MRIRITARLISLQLLLFAVAALGGGCSDFLVSDVKNPRIESAGQPEEPASLGENLIADPGFERGAGGFVGEAPAERDLQAPLSGQASLIAQIASENTPLAWTKTFDPSTADYPSRARSLVVAIRAQALADNGADLKVCAVARSLGGELAQSCVVLDHPSGVWRLEAHLPLTQGLPIVSLELLLFKDAGTGPARYRLDDALAMLSP